MGRFTIRLEPLGVSLGVEPGTPLQDLLFPQGVEFPCGGQGRCKGCRIKVLKGELPVSPEDERLLSAADRAAGWRLACRARVRGDLQLELAQWEATILADDTRFAFTPREGFGVAVDLGTTTVVAQLLDLRTGQVLAVRSALNDQARHGADIMSRIGFAIDGGQSVLERLVRAQLGSLIGELVAHAIPGPCPRLDDIVIVGNSAMHHLFCGVHAEPLSHHPFEPSDGGLKSFAAVELGWNLPGNPRVRFLPCLGSFVGSDLLAGVLATGLHESHEPVALVDLGTNGEIVLGNRERMLCASTAAGPAFEGARIASGMRAASGAISEVRIRDGSLECHTLGNAPARGICGSGLVSAVAACLDLGWVLPNGRMHANSAILLSGRIHLQPCDIRELQLAKGAITAGLRLLAKQWGTTLDGLERVYLAGAFGNYLNLDAARRIGLLPFPLDRIVPSGNTALLGAKLALFNLPAEPGAHGSLCQRVAHVPLNEDPEFQDVFVEEMGFPPVAPAECCWHPAGRARPCESPSALQSP